MLMIYKGKTLFSLIFFLLSFTIIAVYLLNEYNIAITVLHTYIKDRVLFDNVPLITSR